MQSKECWFALGDIHMNSKLLEKIPFEQAQGVIVTGDSTLCGGVAELRQVLEPIAAATPQLLVLAGNMDKPETSLWIEEQGWQLDAHCRELAHGIVIAGLGGSNKTPFNTPNEFSEEELVALLDGVAQQLDSLQPQHILFVSHTPPVNTQCDRLASGIHVGSIAVRSFIERIQPDVCVCGHIHESKGIDFIGKTVIVNPGDFPSGGYVVLELDEKGIKVTLQTIQ